MLYAKKLKARLITKKILLQGVHRVSEIKFRYFLGGLLKKFHSHILIFYLNKLLDHIFFNYNTVKF